jgi:hypothetical protein
MYLRGRGNLRWVGHIGAPESVRICCCAENMQLAGSAARGLTCSVSTISVAAGMHPYGAIANLFRVTRWCDLRAYTPSDERPILLRAERMPAMAADCSSSCGENGADRCKSPRTEGVRNCHSVSIGKAFCQRRADGYRGPLRRFRRWEGHCTLMPAELIKPEEIRATRASSMRARAVPILFT